MTPCLKRKVDK